ncbi:MAG: UDP-N-acetylmuramoyl-L-alanyl-D-glutamate--2,6-diaminopimelate ligase, partial [Alphaproteobacteria bacterium]|nr:UDP-N-acetylmuramoyl-L-alanyl-D-glutamate--2,6-diaminopimelate ligase [Alphaproteobacteria bacterium]
PPAPEAGEGGIVLLADDPRAALARLAARFHAAQPETVVAVTGTNGKTSVAEFTRQIWTALGARAASLGTIGLRAPAGVERAVPGLTTLDPVALHALLADLAGAGIGRLAIEASSHGLDQHRLDGVRLAAAGFTNLTRDHLDYHGTMEAYRDAKLRLFTECLDPGGTAVINAAGAGAPAFLEAVRRRGLACLTVGGPGTDIALLSLRTHARGLGIDIGHAGRMRALDLPLYGGFQAYNALVAAGLALATGGEADAVFGALQQLAGAPGRMDKVAEGPGGAPVFVDYAHTPDALETVLKALRPHVTGRLHVVFGAGGDRDRGKRPLMGAAAKAFADAVIVTDDNPRGEEPASIRAAILAACPGAREIGDRAEAIEAALAGLGRGDVLVIAGKGHESGQIVGERTLPFSDAQTARAAAARARGEAHG